MLGQALILFRCNLRDVVSDLTISNMRTVTFWNSYEWPKFTCSMWSCQMTIFIVSVESAIATFCFSRLNNLVRHTFFVENLSFDGNLWIKFKIRMVCVRMKSNLWMKYNVMQVHAWQNDHNGATAFLCLVQHSLQRDENERVNLAADIRSLFLLLFIIWDSHIVT